MMQQTYVVRFARDDPETPPTTNEHALTDDEASARVAPNSTRP
jgi:hypothetical protein